MGSRVYDPPSDQEKKVFEQATRGVFPKDVLTDTEKHTNELVAWAGVIRDYKVSDEEQSIVIKFDVEHRYFDWIEDKGVQREVFFLSPRGEGNFRLAWRMPLEARNEVHDRIKKGDMLIAYGVPSMVSNNVVGFYPTKYVRLIESKWWRDDVLDYSRPGEPVTRLKTPR
jgi:hypothetical protein